MNSLEDLDTAIYHQGAALPDLLIDLEDSDGDDVDLSTGYGTFSAKFLDPSGDEVTQTTVVTGTTTGFRIAFPAAGIALAVGEYTVQATCERTSDSKPRRGYCLLQVLAGF